MPQEAAGPPYSAYGPREGQCLAPGHTACQRRGGAPAQDLRKTVCSAAGLHPEAAGDGDEAWRRITRRGWMSGQWVGVAKPDGKRQLETCPQPGQGCLPAAVLCCPCVPAHSSRAVTILTNLLVAAGSEIVARWGVMSTSPLSNRSYGNLAGATRLQGPRQGGRRGHRDGAGGWAPMDKALASSPTSPTGRQGSMRISLQCSFFLCGL